MTQRGRTRNAGIIDSSLGETVPWPIAPAWVSGRFYGPSLTVAGSFGTLTPNTNAYVSPVIVPNMVTVTSIGVEITSAGGAGSLLRFAIYTDRNSSPFELVLDAGTVAADSTGFQSASISQVLKAGVYWMGIANKIVTTAPIVRATGATFTHSITAACAMTPSGTGIMYMLLQNNPTASGIVDAGWPNKIYFGDSNAILYGAAAGPRTMLGV